MLDFDLSELYQVETRVLKQAVRRNLKRFPQDFMFELSKEEWSMLITNCDNLPKNVKFSPAKPFAFTEQGVSMLSSVLKSDVAIEINISIMRIFVQLRKMAFSNIEIKEEVKKLEVKYDKQFSSIYEALDYLLKKDKQEKTQEERKKIGYKH